MSTAFNATKLAARIKNLESELATIPHGRSTARRREHLQELLARCEDQLELGPPPSYDPGTDPLYEGLADEDELDQVVPHRPGRTFRPSREDEAAYREMLAARAFEPAAPPTRKPPSV